MFRDKTHPRPLTVVLFFLLAILVTACEEDTKNSGIPTIAPEFLQPTAQATFTPLPSLTPVSNPTATRELAVRNILIFDDGFQNGWQMITENLFAELTTDLAFDGTQSIKISPRLDGSSIYFVAGENSSEAVLLDDIIAVSFYMNGGSVPIGAEDMTITAQGSNELTYWRENDRSTVDAENAQFEDTQLSFLGVSVLPADRWARLEFFPQDQAFDPVYTNFTGFYLSSYSPGLPPFYVDRIEILVVDG